MLANLSTWLEANVAEVAALDGPVKVHVDQADQGAAVPHIVISRLHEDPHNTLLGVGGFKAADVEIDCKARTPDAAQALADAIVRDLEPYSGAMGSITCEAVILEDTIDSFEAARPGRDVDLYLTTLEILFQYR
jgi:hypothetical protein